MNLRGSIPVDANLAWQELPGKLQWVDLPLSGLKLLRPRVHADHRGNFMESWNRESFRQAGIECEFVQDNQSLSVCPGTLRGLHFQAPPHAQAKLVRCLQGKVFDVAVDMRKGSPTFGQWLGVELSRENHLQLFLPEGFLHGFATIEPHSVVFYKCSALYAPEHERAVRFDDPELGIDWGMAQNAIVISERDSQAPFWRELDSPFVFEALREQP